MIHVKKISLVSLIFLISFCKMTYAEQVRIDTTHTVIQTEEPTQFYLRAAAGVGLPPGGIAYIRVDYGKVFFSLRACGAADFLSGTKAEDFSFISGIYGLKKNYYWSIGAGVGKVNSYREVYTVSPNPPKYQESHSEKKSTWGITMQGDFIFLPSRYIGFGIVLFGNFNSEQNFGGVAFCIQVGLLR
jgi:hypothetical protein